MLRTRVESLLANHPPAPLFWVSRDAGWGGGGGEGGSDTWKISLAGAHDLLRVNAKMETQYTET